ILTVLVLTGIAVVLMATDLLRAELAAWFLVIVLSLIGVITPQEAFTGLSNTAVITILAVFILTNGLRRTGVIRRVGQLLQRLAGSHTTRFLLLTMIGGASLSLFMNNIAAAAVLLPAIMDVARQRRISPSKLLMPLAFAANLGGHATLLATSNILVSSTLQHMGLVPYGLLDFAPVGLPMIVVGILYMLLVGHRMLPVSDPLGQLGRTQQLQKELTEAYALEERLSEVWIPAKSPLAGQSLADSQIGARLGLSILAICRDDQLVCMAPGPEQVLEAGDTLLVAGRSGRVQRLNEMGAKVLDVSIPDNGQHIDQIILSEVVLAPRSDAAGHTLKDLRFREKYNLGVVAIWRGGRPYRTDVGDMPLQFGDALLVQGSHERLAVLRTDPDFLVLAGSEVPPRTEKEKLAGAIMVLTLITAATGLLPIAVAMMLGALAMIATGCLTMDEAYRAVEWRAIFLIAGMLPVGIALMRSGVAEWLGQLLVTSLSAWGPLALAGGMLVLTMLLSQVMSGQVTAVVLTPIAVAAAQQVGANPRAFAMAVAMGCGMVFMTPTAHPVNVFVMGPGGYKFRDFLRVGLPLTLLLCLTVLLVLPIFWPLG
ncbi:MAG: SLC13 family permease, partial [Anaerolineae bacterium]